MIQSLLLEALYASAPIPSEALTFAEDLLAGLVLERGRIQPTPAATGPLQGVPWTLGMALTLGHPALPRRPYDASLEYFPAGKTSPGGFALSAPVFEVSGTDPEVLAETFASLAASWVAVSPPDTLLLHGTPGQPDAKALRVLGFPAQLGWQTWLNRNRWPLAERALGVSVVGAKIWEQGEGIWIQASPRLGDPPDTALEAALSAAVGRSVLLRTGGAGVTRGPSAPATAPRGARPASRLPGPALELRFVTARAPQRGLSLDRLRDWCPGQTLEIRDGEALAALATLKIGAAFVLPTLLSLGVEAGSLPTPNDVERAFSQFLPPDDEEAEAAEAAAAWLRVERGPGPAGLLFLTPDQVNVARAVGRELLARRELGPVALMLASAHAPTATSALLESIVAAPTGAALLGWASDIEEVPVAPPGFVARDGRAASTAPNAAVPVSDTISVSHEGIVLGSGAQLERAIVEILASRTWTRGRDDRHPHDWLVRAWRAWGGARSPYAAEIARGTAAALDSAELVVVAGAVWFFQFLPEAPDGGALGRALLRDGAAFADVPDPLGESHLSLRGELARAVACSARRATDPTVLAALRDLALVRGDGVAVIAGLFYLDRTFIDERVGDLVRANPSSLATVLLNASLCRQDPTVLLAGAIGAIGTEEVRAAINAIVGLNPTLRDAWLALARTGP